MQPPIRHQCYRRIFQLHKAFLIALFFAAAIGHAQGIPGLTPLPKVTLTKATTPDAKTVVLTYAVLGASPNSIHFDLYRSPSSNATTNSILSADDANPSDLTVGEHTVSFTPVAGLPLNTALPYVVVVATSGGKKSTVYFRKFLIGVIAHGFDRWAFANNFSPVSLVSVPQWETTMARSLKLMDNYDDVIAFNWNQTCAAPRPGMAVQAGHELATEVLAKTVIRNRHPGDVVDLHFIAHSRGAVVVTEAIKDLAAQDPLLAGSFVELTLLDPHPASNCFAANCAPINNPDSPWASFAKDSRNQLTPAAQIARTRVARFQQAAADPPVTIPPGIKKVEVWFQHTPTSCFSPRALEHEMNLWGIADPPGLVDQSGLLTQPTDKTNCSEAIGHNQIPTLYQTQIVETGNLNRQPQ
jgi:hypothetical protein